MLIAKPDRTLKVCKGTIQQGTFSYYDYACIHLHFVWMRWGKARSVSPREEERSHFHYFPYQLCVISLNLYLWLQVILPVIKVMIMYVRPTTTSQFRSHFGYWMSNAYSERLEIKSKCVCETACLSLFVYIIWSYSILLINLRTLHSAYCTVWE